MNRGNRKSVLFEDDRDRRRFLQLLAGTTAEFAIELIAGCLMDNHFHFVVHTPAGNVSEFMQQLEGQFAKYSNWRHKRVGHVFQGRFKSVIVEDDIHLLTVVVYVLMNPIVAGYVTKLEHWKWSSYRATVGFDPAPCYLSMAWIDELFPSMTRGEGQAAFLKLINDTEPIQAYIQDNQPVFGSEALKQVVRSYVGQQLYRVDVPRSLRALGRPRLADLFNGDRSTTNLAQIVQRAHVVHGYKYAEIARALTLHPSTISKMMHRLRRRSI